jgi:Protein of unknown function (DUF2283).
MAKKVKVYYDKGMDTLDIWFNEPPEEGFSREIGDGIILKYNPEARVVGIEILFLSKQNAVVNVMPSEIRAEFEKIIKEFANTVKAIA